MILVNLVFRAYLTQMLWTRPWCLPYSTLTGSRNMIRSVRWRYPCVKLIWRKQLKNGASCRVWKARVVRWYHNQYLYHTYSPVNASLGKRHPVLTIGCLHNFIQTRWPYSTFFTDYIVNLYIQRYTLMSKLTVDLFVSAKARYTAYFCIT